MSGPERTISPHPSQAPDELKPPVTAVGPLGWLRKNLFNTPFNAILTCLTLFFLWKTVPPLLRWAFVNAQWLSPSSLCRQSEGACWSVISQNLRFILFGFYPYEQQWRPTAAMILLLGLVFFPGTAGFGPRLWPMPGLWAWQPWER